MHGKGIEWWGAYEPFHIMLNEYRVADILLTAHAKSRFLDRVNRSDSENAEIAAWMWQCLKLNRIRRYSQSEYNAFLVDNDTVIIAEFKELEGVRTLSGHPLYKMIIVSCLGNLSATPQLRDLKTYYSWLRHNRRIKLMKRRRKRR